MLEIHRDIVARLVATARAHGKLLKEANLSRADVSRMNISDLRLVCVDFKDADLRGTVIDPNKVTDCNFEGAYRNPNDHVLPGWVLIDGKLTRDILVGLDESELNVSHLPRNDFLSIPPGIPVYHRVGRSVIVIDMSETHYQRVWNWLKSAHEYGVKAALLDPMVGIRDVIVVFTFNPDSYHDPDFGRYMLSELKAAGIQAWPTKDTVSLPNADSESANNPPERLNYNILRILPGEAIHAARVIAPFLDY